MKIFHGVGIGPLSKIMAVKMSSLNLVTCVTSQSEDPNINFEGCFEDKSKVNNSHFSAVLYTMGPVHSVSA